MAECFVNVFLSDEDQKKLKEVDLGDQIKEIEGKKAVQVPMTKKDLKKLQKNFPDLALDASNACVLPEEAKSTLLDIIYDVKSTDVMKFAITKLYNPLAGKEIRSKVH